MSSAHPIASDALVRAGAVRTSLAGRRGVVLSEPLKEPDRDWIRLALSPDAAIRDQAFEALYRRHGERVYRLARRLAGQDADARDIVQEAFLRVFKRVARFRREAAFASWLYRVTVNVAIDRHRQRARRPAAPLDATPALEPTTDEGEGPVARALSNEQRDEVRRAMLELSPKLSTVVLLRYVEGLSYDEIASAVGLSIGTVKSRLNRAHRLLERRLGPNS